VEALQWLVLFEGLIDLLEDSVDLSDLLDHFLRGVSLNRQVIDQHHQRFHPFQIPHGFPAHCLVDVKQYPLLILKTGMLDGRFAQTLPCALQIAEDRFLIA
jgi:hypothetical protein